MNQVGGQGSIEIFELGDNDVQRCKSIVATTGGDGWSMSELIDSLNSGYDVFLLLVDQREIGCCVIRHINPELEILNVMIAEGHQRKGYGRAFLKLVFGFDKYQHARISGSR